MIPNKEYILQLLVKNHWSQNKFAQKAGVSKTTVSRWLKGLRGAGKDLISGIIIAFPCEPIDKLFFLPNVSPNGHTKAIGRDKMERSAVG
ncbi:MAG: helix-turn-helix transcriptional regulator [Ruminiclostridium sp.]|nr:helix-turn-helix transcriptional regulator [Ruminiclostridium sp.]